MGILTLEEMTQELSLNMQGNNIDPVRLKRWVWFGLLNMASFRDLPELRTKTTLDVLMDDDEYTLPTDLLGIRTVSVDDRWLVKRDREPLNPDDERVGQPLSWFRRGTTLFLYPIPDDDYPGGYIEYIRTPTRMEDRDDVTDISPIWDLAVLYLATHHGFIALNRQDEADRWLGRALGYINSRITEKDIEADTPRGGGVNVAWTLDDIRDNPPHYDE